MPDENIPLPKSLKTFGGRVAHVSSVVREYKNPSALANAMTAAGHAITPVAMRNIWEDKSDPHAKTKRAISEFLEFPYDDLVYGSREGEDSLYITELKAIEGDLEPYQWDRLLVLAADMANETRRRRVLDAERADITPDELAVLRRMRGLSPASRSSLLESLPELEQTDKGRETAAPQEPARTRRANPQSA